MALVVSVDLCHRWATINFRSNPCCSEKDISTLLSRASEGGKDQVLKYLLDIIKKVPGTKDGQVHPTASTLVVFYFLFLTCSHHHFC